MKRSTNPGSSLPVLTLWLLGAVMLSACNEEPRRPGPDLAVTEECGGCAGEAGCESGQDAAHKTGSAAESGVAHAPEAESGHEEGHGAGHDHGETESSDLDRPVEELLAARCEHDVSTYTCDECRYEVGVVKVVADLIDADGPLDTTRVARHALAETEGYNGEVRLDEERSAYLSPRAAGAVRSILVDLGENVRRGQVLFTVDSPEFAEARAAFIRARASERVAHATLERERDLYEKRVCPRKDLLEAEANHEEAEAELRAARERLLSCGLTAAEIERVGLDDGATTALLPVTAPFDGTVLERSLGLGATVEPGQPLLLLGDTRRMWVLLSLYEREMADVLEQKERGEVRADVTVAAYPGRVFSGARRPGRRHPG